MRWIPGRNDEVPAVACAAVALASIIACVAGLPEGVRAPLVIVAVVIGPAALLWRQLTPRPWWECFAFGAAINIAFVMLFSQLLVSVDLWYPDQFEVVVPALTCLLAWRLGQPPRPAATEQVS